MPKSPLDQQAGMHLNAKPKLFQYARANRDQPTPAEARLWEALQHKRLSGFKFRRQHPISIYILDFYCHACKLAIEVDGGYHSLEDQKEYDKNRSADLKDAGILEVRFTNEDISNDLSSVLASIQVALERRKQDMRIEVVRNFDPALIYVDNEDPRFYQAELFVAPPVP